MLPESSQKVYNYHLPVVVHYAAIQTSKGLSKPEVINVMRKYLATKGFLVREQKAFLAYLERTIV